jgi:hypothetical protein
MNGDSTAEIIIDACHCSREKPFAFRRVCAGDPSADGVGNMWTNSRPRGIRYLTAQAAGNDLP